MNKFPQNKPCWKQPQDKKSHKILSSDPIYNHIVIASNNFKKEVESNKKTIAIVK